MNNSLPALRRLSLMCVICAMPIAAEDIPPLTGDFVWPEGKQAALSLSFDDGRVSQVDVGLDLFEKYGARVTFYLTAPSVEQRPEGWKRAVRTGHEIGNHSVIHPCSGNFAWSREKALENYTLESMTGELADANRRIESSLGVSPVSFAYPCGQKFVGRGASTRSYVPVVAESFLSGRGWLDEGPNDPAFCDLAQLTGMELDRKSFEDLQPLLEDAKARGQWLVLAGHEIGSGGSQTSRTDTLERLLRYAQDPSNGIWIAPVGVIARYVADQRTSTK